MSHPLTSCSACSNWSSEHLLWIVSAEGPSVVKQMSSKEVRSKQACRSRLIMSVGCQLLLKEYLPKMIEVS